VLASGTWANELLAQFARTFPRVQARYNVVEAVSRNGSVDLVSRPSAARSNASRPSDKSPSIRWL